MSDQKTFQDTGSQTESISTFGDIEYILYNNSALPENSKRFAMVFNFCADPTVVAAGQDAIVLITPSTGVSNTVSHSKINGNNVASISNVRKTTDKQLDWRALVRKQTKTSKLLSWFIRRR